MLQLPLLMLQLAVNGAVRLLMAAKDNGDEEVVTDSVPTAG